MQQSLNGVVDHPGHIMTRARRRAVSTFDALLRFSSILPLALASSMAAAAGPTPVSGTISTHTTWIEADSPYVLSGHVEVTGGAYLTIRPGVTVLMNEGSALTVTQGALSAQGLSDNPVVFTSAHDVAGSGVTAAPGDWQALTFADGSIDAASTLSNVELRYGTGLTIVSSSPTLDHVHFDSNGGPAISVDLSSSPRGRNLTANNNQLDGILVPPGTIAQDASWALVGIPYVVAEGTVEVGLRPFSFDPDTRTVASQLPASLDLFVPQVAPQGGTVVALASDQPAVVQVPATVVIPAGHYTVSVPLVAQVSGQIAVDAMITATHAQFGDAHAIVTVEPNPRLVISPAEIELGTGRSGTLSIQVPAGSTDAGAVTIELAASNPNVSVPASTTIPQGGSSMDIEVTGNTAGVATVEATGVGFTGAEALVRVHTMKLTAPGNIYLGVGGERTIVLGLSDPAPAGLVLDIANNRQNVLDVETSIDVPAGATTIAVPVRGLVDSALPAQLDFAAAGYQAAGTVVTVRQWTITLGNGDRIVIPQGGASTPGLSLSPQAPPGGMVITFEGDAAHSLGISPAQVTIPGGSTAASIAPTLTGLAPTQAELVPVSSNVPGVQGLSIVEVKPPVQLRTSRQYQVIGAGLISYLGNATRIETPVRFEHPVVIDITLDHAGRVDVPTSVILPADTSWVTLPITGLEPSADVRISFAVNQPGVLPPPPMTVAIVEPVLLMHGFEESHVRWVGSEREWHTAELSVPATAYSSPMVDTSMAPTAGTLELSVIEADSSDPSAILDGIFLTEGSAVPISSISLHPTQSTYAFALGTPLTTGAYRIKGAVSGMHDYVSPTQVIEEPRLLIHDRFVEDEITQFLLGKDLHTTLYISAKPYIGGECQEGSTSVSVSDPSKVSATHQFDEGSCEDLLILEGLDLADVEAPVVVTVERPGYESATLAVAVAPASVRFYGLDDFRALSGELDAFDVEWAGDGTQIASVDTVVALNVLAQTPAGVLGSPAIIDNEGQALTQLVIPAGEAYSGEASVVSPSALGTYRLSAVHAGVTSESDLQVVSTAHVTMSVESNPVAATGAYPLGEGLTDEVEVFFDGDVDPQGTQVTLVSRAPAWVQFIDDGAPVDEIVVTIMPEELSSRVTVVGLGESPAPIQIDAYVGEDTLPAGTLSLQLMKPLARFRMQDLRPLNDTPAPVEVYFELEYICPGNEVGTQTCRIEQWPMPGYSIQLSTTAEAGAPVVSGFRDANGQPVTGMTWTDAESPIVYADMPTGAGSYRIQATSGSTTWTSEPVRVGGERRRVLETPRWFGKGLTAYGRMNATVDGIPVGLGNTVTLSAACVDTQVCSVGAIEADAGTDTATIPVHALAEGQTQLHVEIDGQTYEAAVNVVKPALRWSGTIPQTFHVGDQTTLSLMLSEDFSGQVPSTPLDIEVSSLVAGVVTATPAQVSIGEWPDDSPDIVVHAAAAGRTSIKAEGALVQSALSNVVVVN